MKLPFGLQLTKSTANDIRYDGLPLNTFGFGGFADSPTNGVSRRIRSDYENAFAPNIAIADEVIRRNIRLSPKGEVELEVDEQLAFTSSHPLWYALTHPNNAMGFTQFITVLTGGFMALPELSLLLWSKNANGELCPGAPEGGFNETNVWGFTVLPRTCRGVVDGRYKWTVHTRKWGLKEFYNDSVMTLRYAVLPDDGITGISPGSATAQEAAIRDALNQFERGFFANGARPSLIVTIYAATKEEYEAIRQAYEMSNRGAGKQGGVVYQSVIERKTAMGVPQPRIEVTPVGEVNNTLAINDIVGYTSVAINAAYGVSPLIMGDTTAVTFQNQQIIDRKFMGKVDSVSMRLFSELEREFERIFKVPLTFRFAWDSANVEIAEEQDIKAKTLLTKVQTIRELITMGADSDAAVKAVGLAGEDWDGLSLERPVGFSVPASNAVLEVEPAKTLPEPTAEAAGRKARVAIRQPDEITKVYDLLHEFTEHRIDKALGRVDNAITQQEQLYIDDIVDVIHQLADRGGVVAARQLANLIEGFRVSVSYEMSPEAWAEIEKRVVEQMDTYSDFLDGEIAAAQEKSPEDWVSVIEASVTAGLIGSRIQAITTMETKHAFQTGQLDSAINVQRDWQAVEPNGYLIKTWHATGAHPCEFCSKIDGTEASIEDTFVPEGLIHAGEHTLVLDTDYSDGSTPDAHVNCECTFGFGVKVRK